MLCQWRFFEAICYVYGMKNAYLSRKIMRAAFLALLSLGSAVSLFAGGTHPDLHANVGRTHDASWVGMPSNPVSAARRALISDGANELAVGAEAIGGKKGKRPKCPTPDLLAPSLTCHVAVLPQESLFGNDALTFLNSQYQTVVTTLPTRMYRAFGGSAMPGGSFVTPDTLADTSKTRNELAILVEWGNTLEFEAVIKVPVVVKLNIGLAAPQAHLTGGGEQVIMPHKWNTDWIERVYHTRSSKSWTLAEFKAAYPQYFPK